MDDSSEGLKGGSEGFDGWAIVELMGHVTMAGRLTEVKLFGGTLGRLDIPDEEGDSFSTRYFGSGGVYRITPCTEAVARYVAKRSPSPPAFAWGLQLEAPRAEPPTFGEAVDDGFRYPERDGQVDEEERDLLVDTRSDYEVGVREVGEDFERSASV